MKIDRSDWTMVAGIALLVGGVGWVYRPAGPILLGILLMAFSYVTARE